jgi:endonuclease G
MKRILAILFLLPVFTYAQEKLNKMPEWDTVITNPVYVSFHNQKAGSPVAVVYKLYKGGGPCSRAGFRFINDLKVKTATSDDYAKSGYDKGHMANSEDFANNCPYDELTFRFYNCTPQKPELNRGPWRMLESKIRDASQTDSLLVFCVNIYGDTSLHLGNSRAVVPTICIKAAKSITTGKYLYFVAFTNTSTPAEIPTLTQLELEKKYGISMVSLEKIYGIKTKK